MYITNFLPSDTNFNIVYIECTVDISTNTKTFLNKITTLRAKDIRNNIASKNYKNKTCFMYF